ncbi:alpha/beta fold hydrolase [Pseudomarimonas salicorniae]|uniref:Alpha/beta hydrolase n=1 Tax=Pseudomarimonas salicorniae TaxID=2933270 RepID=A0ABT0GGA3_9GAMM|nr:alpha/beta hydrolase [Lysobacter sp. CAU 1642]MCK7593573.1 alpha/beta hydrolase [Lysobacter sp. CAU 1642]
MTMVQLEGLRLRVRRFGEGPPVLLIHGLGSSGDDWAFQIGPLAERFGLIVPDLRGCGASEATPGRYRIEQFAADLWALLDRLEAGRPALVGFSMGGAVALEMALQRPGAVARLVTINSLPSYRVDHWRKALELHLQVGMVRLLGLPRTARMVARRLFPEPHQLAMRQRVERVVGSSSPDPYLRCARALADWCAAERASGLGVPMLMLAGEHDYTSLAEKRLWATRLSAELHVVAGSRHGTPFDAIGDCNRALLAFLSGQPVPEGLRADRPEDTPDAPPPLPPERSPTVGLRSALDPAHA